MMVETREMKAKDGKPAPDSFQSYWGWKISLNGRFGSIAEVTTAITCYNEHAMLYHVLVEIPKKYGVCTTVNFFMSAHQICF